MPDRDESRTTDSEQCPVRPPDGVRWSRQAVYWFFLVLTLAGLLVRLSVRDAWPGLATLFYATPLPVLAAGAAFCLLFNYVSRRPRTALAWGLLLLVLLPWWGWQDWRMPPREDPVPASPDNVGLFFWNVARWEDLTSAAERIRQINADIVGLVEVTGDVEQRRAFFQEQLPGYDVSVLGGNMYLLAKGDSGQAQAHRLAGGSQGRQLTVTIRGQAYEVFLVDLDSDVFRSRREALETLAALAEEQSERPVIIMGDFNTPPDSVHYARLRQAHRLVFAEAGAGYAPTWPVPLCVLQLDQIWINSRLDPIECRHAMTFVSDHCAVRAVVRVRR